MFRNVKIVSDSTGPDPAPFIVPFRFDADGDPNGNITLSALDRIIPINDTTPSLDDGTDFGSTPVVGGTVARTFVLTNLSTDGRYHYSPGTISITGEGAADFSAPDASPDLPAGTIRPLQIVFHPSASGVRRATVSIYYSFGPTLISFDIQGTGTVHAVPAPTAVVLGNAVAIASGDTTPSAIDGTNFGNLAVNAIGFADFVITNTGDATLLLSGTPRVAISGNAAFTVIQQPVQASLLANSSDTFRIRYLPTAVGNATATVMIATNDAARPAYTFTVSGTAVAASQSIVHFASDSVQLVPAAAGTASVTVLRDTGVNQTASVTWQTVAGTAAAGSEFTAGNGTISFAAGEVAKPISIAILSGAVAGHAFSIQLASTDASVTLTAPSSAQIQFAGGSGGGSTPIPGDLNNSGTVTFEDLALFLSS